MQRRDRRLYLVRAGTAQRERAIQQTGRLGDQALVPFGPVLILEPDQPSPSVEAGRGARLVQEEEGEETEDLGFPRHEAVQRAGEGDRLRREVAAGGLAAGAGQVSLVEHEVDDGQYSGQPFAKLVWVGDRDPRLGLVQGLASAQQPLGHRRLGDEERLGDLPRGQPAHRSQGERDLGVPRKGRVAAGERQAEQLIVGTAVAGRGHVPAGAGATPTGMAGSVRDREQCQLPGTGRLPADPVQRLAARGGHEPAAGVGGGTFPRPVLGRRDQRVLQGVLGEPDIA